MLIKLNETMLVKDIASVKAQYPNIEDSIFNELIALDPTFNPDRNSVGKYGKWILNLYKKGNITMDDFDVVTDYLNTFEKEKRNFQNKDIGQFKTLDALADALENVEDVELTDRQKLRQKQKARKNSNLNNEAELVFEDSEWEVWIPKTYEASCKLGVNSHWCTATTEDDSYYKSYSRQGNLYIIINKNQPNTEKYQLHFESNSFMDIDDNAIDFSDIQDIFSSELLSFLDTIAVDYCDINLETTEYTLTETEYEQILEHATHRNMIRSDFILDYIYGDAEIIWDAFMDYGYAPDDMSYEIESMTNIKDSEILNELGIDYDTLISIASDESVDIDDYLAENIRDAIRFAYEDAQVSGAINECVETIHDAVVSAWESADIQCSDDLKTLDYANALDDTGISTIHIQTWLNYANDYVYYYDITYNELINNAIAIFVDNFRCYEPYYGFDGFDSDTFREQLYDRLAAVEV